MKINLTTILVGLVLILIIGLFIGRNYYENRLDDVTIELRKERIKNDSLVILATGQARKLVADTLTQRELRRKIEELGLEIRGIERSITEIELKPRDTIKETDTVVVTEGIVSITDFYPDRNNFFVKYENEIDTETQTGNSIWSFSEVGIDLVVSQNEDGTFETNMKAPDFIRINKLDVQSTPLTPVKKDNFGILLGAGYGRHFVTGQDYLEIGGGVRFNKFYIILEGNTNNQADLGVKFEF